MVVEFWNGNNLCTDHVYVVVLKLVGWSSNLHELVKSNKVVQFFLQQASVMSFFIGISFGSQAKNVLKFPYFCC